VTTQTTETAHYFIDAESPEQAERVLAAYIEGADVGESLVGAKYNLSDENIAGITLVRENVEL